MLFKDLLKERENLSENVCFTLIGDVSKIGVISSVHEDFLTLIEEDNNDNIFIPFDSIIYME